MSATAVSPTTGIFYQPGDNRFELSDHEGRTKITLMMQHAGPLRQGEDQQPGPAMMYQGAEGSFSFSGSQVVVEKTVVGALYTVNLHQVPDQGTLRFSLLLPAVQHQTEGAAQSFHTIGIRSEAHTSLQGTPTEFGESPTYSVVKLHGVANKVEIAL